VTGANVDLDYLLDNSDTLLYWDDPATGYDGERVIVNVQQSATVGDCIRMRRYRGKDGVDTTSSERLLLDEFIVINWAYLKEER